MRTNNMVLLPCGMKTGWARRSRNKCNSKRCRKSRTDLESENGSGPRQSSSGHSTNNFEQPTKRNSGIWPAGPELCIRRTLQRTTGFVVPYNFLTPLYALNFSFPAFLVLQKWNQGILQVPENSIDNSLFKPPTVRFKHSIKQLLPNFMEFIFML